VIARALWGLNDCATILLVHVQFIVAGVDCTRKEALLLVCGAVSGVLFPV